MGEACPAMPASSSARPLVLSTSSKLGTYSVHVEAPQAFWRFQNGYLDPDSVVIQGVLGQAQ